MPPDARKGNAPSTPKPLKVAILCHSDNLGGASIVTHRLCQALRQEGVDARMIVFNKMSDDPEVTAIGSRFRRGYTFMAERLGIALANGFSRENLFKVSTATRGFDLSRHPQVADADIILLSWINQGMLSLGDIRKLGRLGKPMVWVMHDMWNLTGICHHALECTAYTEQCGACQFLKSNNPNDLSHTTWLRKQRLYNDCPLTFVAVSNWLADCCRRSSLLAGHDVRVIPNAFPVDTFTPTTLLPLSVLPPDREIILMGAARLDDPIKGLDYALDALNHLFDNNPEAARNSVAVFFGATNNPECYDRLRFPHINLGRINDPTILRGLYARAKVVLSTSLYETLPGTLIEGQAAGCLPVTFGRGGQADIVDHKVNGYIARYKDVADVAQGILWALQTNVDEQMLHESVRERFSSLTVGRRFIDLFNELLNRKERSERFD